MAPNQRNDHPTYPLGNIQTSVKAGDFDIRMSAQIDIRALGFAAKDVRKCVCSLKEACEANGGHFYKTMEADDPRARERGLWQDVYRVPYKHFILYVKLQHPDGGRPVLISFKEK